MATQTGTQQTGAANNWYSRSPGEVAADLGVDPAAGLPAARAAELLAANGPNALPEEKPKPHARGVRARGAGHPDGRVQPPARHGPAQPAPVRPGARARRRAAGAVGTRQAHRPATGRPGGNLSSYLVKRG